jgi:putative transcriptional regulator
MAVDIRKRIRDLRKAKGMSAKEVSERMGISRPFYTQLEGGTRRLSVRYLEGIAKALSTTPSELYSDDGPPMPNQPRSGARRYRRQINVPELSAKLRPYVGDQSDAVAAAIDNWQIALRAMQRELKRVR